MPSMGKRTGERNEHSKLWQNKSSIKTEAPRTTCFQSKQAPCIVLLKNEYITVCLLIYCFSASITLYLWMKHRIMQRLPCLLACNEAPCRSLGGQRNWSAVLFWSVPSSCDPLAVRLCASLGSWSPDQPHPRSSHPVERKSHASCAFHPSNHAVAPAGSRSLECLLVHCAGHCQQSGYHGSYGLHLCGSPSS